MKFEFASAGRVVFGPGTRHGLPTMARMFGRRVLVVTGSSTQRAAGLVEALEVAGMECRAFAVVEEPSVEQVEKGAAEAIAHACDLVIGIGGGSPIDAAKAIAALSTNRGEATDYLETVGTGKPLEQPPLPCIAVPTTAGTGAEVTRNSVLSVPSHRQKVSLRHPQMLPRVAVVDPELTHDLPPGLTASTGLDALTQLIEPFVSCRANPLADGFCREGIPRVARSLREACAGGTPRAREDMALASLLGGMALANAGLGAVHGFAGPIGGMFAAPHGAVCAALLPHVMEANLAALREREPRHQALRRFDEIACLLTGRFQATAADGIRWVRKLVDGLAIPGLRHHGLASADMAAIVEKAARASSMKANPLVLTNEELARILHAAM